MLRKGLGWIVGDGEQISIWKEPWLSCATPETPIGPYTEEAASLKVCDLLCPLTNAWDTSKIRCHLLQYEDAILQIITSSTQVNDSLQWLPEKTGVYSTKSGYRLAKKEDQDSPHSDVIG